MIINDYRAFNTKYLALNPLCFTYKGGFNIIHRDVVETASVSPEIRAARTVAR